MQMLVFKYTKNLLEKKNIHIYIFLKYIQEITIHCLLFVDLITRPGSIFGCSREGSSYVDDYMSNFSQSPLVILALVVISVLVKQDISLTSCASNFTIIFRIITYMHS